MESRVATVMIHRRRKKKKLTSDIQASTGSSSVMTQRGWINKSAEL